MVIGYTVGGKAYLQFANWGKFQRVRAQKSKYPDPPADAATVPISQSSADIRTHPHASATSTRTLTRTSTDSLTSTKSSCIRVYAYFTRVREADDAADDDLAQTVTWFVSEHPKSVNGAKLSETQAAELRKRILRIAPGRRREWCELTLKQAADHGGRSWAYMCKILDDALASGHPPGSNGNVEEKRGGRCGRC